MKDKKILLVGCGKMGSALLSGIEKAGALMRNIIVIDPNAGTIFDNFNVRIIKEFEQDTITDFAPDLIILAVKPQIAASVLPHYKQFANSAVFISIIAGKTTEFFENHLGKNAAIVRTMPNLPLSIQKGMTAIYLNNNVTLQQKEILPLLFSSPDPTQTQGNDFVIIDNESMMDAVTAISGSGPAYLFLFIECLTNAGIELGLPEEMARKLAIKTIEGSIALAIEADCYSPAMLREMVTSKAGTTEAALKVLMSGNKMQELIFEATTAAHNRSKELSE